MGDGKPSSVEEPQPAFPKAPCRRRRGSDPALEGSQRRAESHIPGLGRGDRGGHRESLLAAVWNQGPSKQVVRTQGEGAKLWVRHTSQSLGVPRSKNKASQRDSQLDLALLMGKPGGQTLDRLVLFAKVSYF